MDIHSIAKEMMTNIITGEFLESVEKWARYDGEDFWIGDMDVSVKNLGTFVQSKETPKLIFEKGGKFNFQVSKTETEKYEEIYDVTLVKNNARCTDYDKIVLIAKRHSKHFDILEQQKRPTRVYIYAIDEDYNEHKANNEQYTQFPTLERLKEDFEASKYTSYRSLLSEFCGQYSLSAFNDKSDRIFSITGISMDLDWLNHDEESRDLCKHIEVAPRNGNIFDTARTELLRKDNETTD